MADASPSPSPADLDAVVEEYLRRTDAGEVIEPEAFIAKHPDVANALRSFFANEQLIRKWSTGSAPPPAGDTASRNRNPTVAPAEVNAAALANPAGSVVLPAMMGRYRVEKELGRGAMGAVYLARDMDLDRPVALKLPHFSSQDNPDLISRFLREARSAAMLAHPNICRVYDVSEHQGTRYIAMEFIDGRPLSAYVRGGSIQARQAASITRKLALGLAEAHKQGIIHRDLKPDNILINKNGEPILTDFGLARETTRGNATATQDGAILGSPAYMPPEQAAGNLSSMGPSSDVYSLGVVLYEMLTGKVPFRGSVVEVLAQVLMKAPKPVRELRPEVDPAIAAICEKMMAKKAVDRYQSMAEVAAALADWIKSPQKSAPAQEALSQTGAELLSTLGDLKITDEEQSRKSVVAPAPGPASKTKSGGSKQTLPPGTAKKSPVRTAQQIQDLCQVLDQLLARKDYPEVIRIVEEIPEAERDLEMSGLYADAVELRTKVERLEVDLQKHLNLVNLPALKKTINQLLAIKPSHSRAKELRKAMLKHGRQGIVKLLKEEGQFDAVGGVWEPWKIAASIGTILLVFLAVSFAVVLYISDDRRTVKVELDDPTAVLKIDGSVVSISGAGTGDVLLKIGPHQYTVERNDVIVDGPHEYVVVKGRQNVLRITSVESKSGDNTAGVPPTGATSPAAVVTTLASENDLPRGKRIDLTPELEALQGKPGVTWQDGVLDVNVTNDPKDFKQQFDKYRGKNMIFRGEVMHVSGNQSWIALRRNGGKMYFAEFREEGARLGRRSQPDLYDDVSPSAVTKQFARFTFVNIDNHLVLFLDGQKMVPSFPLDEKIAEGAPAISVFEGHGRFRNLSVELLDGVPITVSVPPQSTFPSPAAAEINSQLAGRLRIKQQDAGLRAIYPLGRVLSQASLNQAVLPLGSEANAVELELFGEFDVPAQTELTITHNGGSSDGGVTWLYLDDHELGAVGDDRKKETKYEERVAAGTHRLQWKLTGGDLGASNLVDVRNKATGEAVMIRPLSLEPQPQQPIKLTWGVLDITRDRTAPEFSWESAKSRQAVVKNVNFPSVPLNTESLDKFFNSVPTRFTEHPSVIYAEPRAQEIRFDVDQDGFVLLACSFDYQGNDSGGWLEKRWTAQDFTQHGWRQLSENDVGGRLFAPKHKQNQTCFVKYLASGDKYTLVCNKSDPPFLIQFSNAGQSSSPPDSKPGKPPLAIAPFNAEQAKSLQAAWTTHLRASEDHVNSIGMRFRMIPPGEFLMGASDAENEMMTSDKELPRHKVRLTQPYYLSAYETTRGQFAQFVKETGYQTEVERSGRGGSVLDKKGNFNPDPKSSWRNPGFQQDDDHPVVNVTAEDAQAFCRWLSEKEQTEYRLPTEAEWEFACRAGSTAIFVSGDKPEDVEGFGNFADSAFYRMIGEKDAKKVSRFKDGFIYTAPVGKFQPNAFGIYDTLGNVWEVCSDFLGEYPAGDVTDPQGPPTGEWKVGRGGGFDCYGRFSRAATRDFGEITEGNKGFRVVITQKAE
ncbi:MAG: bifunctional serine/threonine-protein kinase/formylglycine-generating enzyme family protein [Planctomycetaceae bacterium]